MFVISSETAKHFPQREETVPKKLKLLHRASGVYLDGWVDGQSDNPLVLPSRGVKVWRPEFMINNNELPISNLFAVLVHNGGRVFSWINLLNNQLLTTVSGEKGNTPGSVVFDFVKAGGQKGARGFKAIKRTDMCSLVVLEALENPNPSDENTAITCNIHYASCNIYVAATGYTTLSADSKVRKRADSSSSTSNENKTTHLDFEHRMKRLKHSGSSSSDDSSKGSSLKAPRHPLNNSNHSKSQAKASRGSSSGNDSCTVHNDASIIEPGKSVVCSCGRAYAARAQLPPAMCINAPFNLGSTLEKIENMQLQNNSRINELYERMNDVFGMIPDRNRKHKHILYTNNTPPLSISPNNGQPSSASQLPVLLPVILDSSSSGSSPNSSSSENADLRRQKPARHHHNHHHQHNRSSGTQQTQFTSQGKTDALLGILKIAANDQWTSRSLSSSDTGSISSGSNSGSSTPPDSSSLQKN